MRAWSWRRWLLLGGAATFVGIVAFVLVWFQPQKLLLDTRVHEQSPLVAVGSPAAPAQPSPSPSPSPTIGAVPTPLPEAPPSPSVVAGGRFVDGEHSTTGRALLIALPAGGHVLRFEDFDTSNGPDLRVYLSAAPPDAKWAAFDDDYVELGKLKGNVGDQNYDVPAGTDLARYTTAVVWCHRFSVPFGQAGLTKV
jgi:hypothetical protein